MGAAAGVIAQRQLGLGAAGFGLLMGCMGSGAVAAGFLIGRVRYGLERLVAGGCVLFAAVMLVCALSPWAAPVYVSLLFGGGAWTAVMSTFNTATQTSAPAWVRSPALAMHTLCALGAFALGSGLWGALSDDIGLAPALCLAAAPMLAGPLLARRHPLRMGERRDVTQAAPWVDLFVTHEPAPEAGPVAVEMRYRIRPEDAGAFLDVVAELRAAPARRRQLLARLARPVGPGPLRRALTPAGGPGHLAPPAAGRLPQRAAISTVDT